ncbi:DNA-processing protein DprA, partial [Patescibacteria group bacterium]|nr:DNA-processing protein DprA [Patescibacteria group bacterium]
MFQNIPTKTMRRNNAEYPKLLNEIHNPPEVLYVKGELEHGSPRLAVVGSRKPTRYGIDMTEELVRGLAAESNVVIVSGLASGIDTAAHKAALKYGSRTIGVLGSGMDEKSFFPQENIHLAEKIIEAGGAVASEYADGTPAMPHHFPERNRIIAGMSLGV